MCSIYVDLDEAHSTFILSLPLLSQSHALFLHRSAADIQLKQEQRNWHRAYCHFNA